jgi:hypothetical protein
MKDLAMITGQRNCRGSNAASQIAVWILNEYIFFLLIISLPTCSIETKTALDTVNILSFTQNQRLIGVVLV